MFVGAELRPSICGGSRKMNRCERLSTRLRYASGLRGLRPLWAAIRPCYDVALRLAFGKRGIERVMNGNDRVRLAVRWRNVSEVYEPTGQ